jgi:4-carboxymuconolactone decarboxylase
MSAFPPVRFPSIPLEQMSPEQRRISEAIMVGRKSMSGPFNGMLRSPTLADPLQQIGAYLRFTAPAPSRLKELAIIMVARFWSAEFEWYIHRGIAEKEGLAPAKADAILGGRRPDGLAADEADVYQFVGELLRTGGVRDATFEAMTTRFGEQIVSEFIALVGYYCTASFFLNVDRQPRPEGAPPMLKLMQPPFEDVL